MSGSPRDVRKNRRYWDGVSDEYQTLHASQLNRWDRPVWGVWGIPEVELGALGEVRGLDVLEYGCGGGQWSIWLARAGARPVGLDLSWRQLEHARHLSTEAGVDLPLVHANAERTPFADESFDLVLCDHGATSFAEPARTVPEVARLLRPGGAFVFNIESPFRYVCWDEEGERVGDRLLLPYFGMGKWDDRDSVTFTIAYGDWIRLFRANGLEVEDLLELRPPSRGRTTYPEYVDHGWARRWPAENIWKVRKRG